jgi:uncharacterized pyridoxal phosphate-containing UPF0001 family protein
MTELQGIAGAVAAVQGRIAAAAARAGRAVSDVRLVAVSKGQPAEAVRAGFAAGLRDFGENKLQEAEEKIAALSDLREQGARWHLVGHLQSNKARAAAALFDYVHSVDAAALGPRLEHGAEESKFGIEQDRLLPALDQLRGSKSLRIVGLMLLPPYEEDPERARPFFRRLRALRDAALHENLLLGGELSMGMSHDFEVAIEEGATMVRVGTALFGPRGKA